MDFASVRSLRGVAFARLAVPVVAAVLLASCGHKDAPEDFVETPANVLYNQGLAYLQQGDMGEAAKKFDQLDKEHPYSQMDEKGLLMSAFTHYRRGDFDNAIKSAQRYITLYPGSQQAAYLQFLIVDSYFKQIPDVSRDQAMTVKTLDAAHELLQRYPDSPYVNSAKKRIEIANDQLAGREMSIGRYYLGQRNYIAAINRFKNVVNQYQSTREIEEALERLTEAYYALGIVSEAQTAAAVLGHNYPDSRWYKDAYALLESKGLKPREDTGSWISKAFRIVGGM